MVTFSERDVVVVPFPFTDRPAAKRRPTVVVSSTVFNKRHQGTILAMVTTVADRWPSDVALQDWQQAGLHRPCWVRFKLFTLDDTLILHKAGALSKRDGQAVAESLARWLAI